MAGLPPECRHEPRGALAVRMVIDKDGRKRSHSFHRILMRSAAKLSYQQAQAAIDGHADARDNVLKNAPHTAAAVSADAWTHAY